MVINTDGEWWTGDTADDVADYLAELAPGGYPVGRAVTAACTACGRDAGFRLYVDDGHGYAERICAGCGHRHLMLDSSEVVAAAAPAPVSCPCGHATFDLAAGFAFREGGEVRWVSVGARCRADGVLGSPAGWKISYGPTDHLLSAV